MGAQNSPQSINFPKAGKCFLVIVGFSKKVAVLLSNKQWFCFHYTIDLFSNRQTFCFHYNTVCFQISNRFVITMQPFCKLLKIILGFGNIIF